MALWDADVHITETLVRELLSQFRDLDVQTLSFWGQGWDNQAWLVNDTWLFRFPRRRIAAELILTEINVLPELAHVLPCQLPDPKWVGSPTENYPYPFAGYRKIEGQTGCSFSFTSEQKQVLVHDLAQALHTLHTFDYTALAPAIPFDEIKRNHLKRNLQKFQERLQLLKDDYAFLDWQHLSDLMQHLSQTPVFEGPTALVHGDLYARHVVVDTHGALSGLIDWGDMHQGDIALDLSLVYGFFEPEAQRLFFESYGHIDENIRQRAYFRAIYSATMVLHYGHDINEAPLIQLGVQGLKRLLKNA